MRSRLVRVLALACAPVIAVVATGCAIERSEPAATASPTAPPTAIPAPTSSPAPPPPVEAPFDKTARSIDDPASIWVVVNRDRPLNPMDYEPADLVQVPVAHTWQPLLRQEAADAVVAMFAAARDEAGLYLASNSAFRSYSTQQGLWTPSDPSTAPPGASEHQTGLAIDIGPESGNCSLSECLRDTPEGQWLAANAWRFGFLLRYPADKVEITGYIFEPWHFRYIGVDLAAEMHETGVTTLEEFFGLPPAPM